MPAETIARQSAFGPLSEGSEYQPVDVAQLRPGGSYKQLIEKRTHPIDELVRVHGRIPTTC
jgi:hypothetical protein